MDLVCSIAICALALVVAIAYAVRVAVAGAAHHARVEAEGESALLSKSVMEMLMWCVQPVVTTLAKLRISADGVTYASLVLGLASGVALATGHFGLGALLALAAAGGDAVDGLLARHLGTGGRAGELLDAAVDRYVDFAFVAGLAIYFRADAPRVTVALLALHGGFMVSYSSAKAEALHVKAPRGSMRRVERAALLVGAASITPLVGLLSPAAQELPVLLALGAIAIFANISAIRRLAAIRAAVCVPVVARSPRAPAPPPDEAMKRAAE
jgi:CDP-diacylglycerol---glycerol-3-phosphate 3-phosphatidyltransferase